MKGPATCAVGPCRPVHDTGEDGQGESRTSEGRRAIDTTTLRWIAPGLVLLAVISVLATAAVGDGLLNGVLVVAAIGLLVAGYALRHRARKQLIYQRDDEH
jgi:hypothetical protein